MLGMQSPTWNRPEVPSSFCVCVCCWCVGSDRHRKRKSGLYTRSQHPNIPTITPAPGAKRVDVSGFRSALEFSLADLVRTAPA